MKNNYSEKRRDRLDKSASSSNCITASQSNNKQNRLRFSKIWMLALLVCLFQAVQVLAQERTVSGKVLDDKGIGIPGVSIYVKGTTKGTITDTEGAYSLSAPEGATLVISSVGYKAQEVSLGTEATLDISLAEDVQRLNEIVVVGYGTQQKKDLTGAVTNLSSKDFNPGPITNPLQSITGRAAGVNITQVGGEPGVDPSVRIRGIASLSGGNDPLVVVDGIQGGLQLLNQIPPSEIESIDILKDASALAIYGSRGNSGVILVTTKKGKEGKTTIEYSGVVSFQKISKKFDIMNASEWRAEAARRGIPATADFGANTDWFDEITRDGFTQTHNLAIGGGTNSFDYRASLTAILQDGVVLRSGSDNFIGRLQGTQRALNDKLTFTFNLNASVLNKDFNNQDRITGAITRRPTDPLFDANGNYFIDPNAFAYTNPYAVAKEILDGDETNNVFGSGRFDYEIIKGLTASAFGSWRKVNRAYGQYRGPKTTQEDARNQKGIATRSTEITNERLADLILNYKKTVGEHSFEGTFVYEWQKQIYEGFTSRGRGFINDILTFNALQSSDISQASSGDVSSYKNDRTLISFLGRANYSYKDRYLLTASFRRDGSSVFGDNNKWANFPSVSLGWRITQESFMGNQNIFDELKLRAGFGVTGNQAGLSPQNSVRLVNPDGTAFFGGGLIPNFAITQNENPDLKWETRQMFNAGLDFIMLKEKLSGSVDFFYGNTKDLLFTYQVPQPPFPFSTIFANVGKALNTGIEVALSYSLIRSQDLDITLAGNFTYIKNEIKELSGSIRGFAIKTDTVRWGNGGITGVASQNDGISYLIKGQSVGTFYLFKHAGVDDNGTQILDDINGNGVIDDGDKSGDRYVAGQALPKYTWAFTPSMRYKNFDLSLVLRGANGHKIYNARRALSNAMGIFGQANVLREAPTNNFSNITYASDFWLENGDFMRLENITLGYNINTSKWGAIKRMRLSFVVNNAFVITDYKGIDPELRQDGGNGFGIDNGIYPRTRNYSIGLNFNLQ